MKAPDKIYIQTNAGETLSSKWTTIPFRDFENTEYIRTDAILKWVKEQESHLTVSSISSDAFQLALDMLKEKLSKL